MKFDSNKDEKYDRQLSICMDQSECETVTPESTAWLEIMSEIIPSDSDFAQVSGIWQINFDRTDAVIWGSGVSYGNSMEISETGTFSYYIGVGGTGQCEGKDGVITVEVEPYESHSSEQEILTLKYENANGTKFIMMDWYGEDVYWVRDVQVDIDTGNGESEPEEKEDISDNEWKEQNKAYGEILWDAYYLGQIDGKEFAAPNTEGNDNGGFAIYDIDGDGIVYYILPEDWDGHYNMTPLDGADYESWKNNCLNNAEEIKDITFQILNEEIFSLIR